MNANYKKCPNGHYYSVQLSSCPYCVGNNDEEATKFQPTNNGGGGFDDGKTRPMGDMNMGAGGFDDGKTRPMGDIGYAPAGDETNLGGMGDMDPEGETIMPGAERKRKPAPRQGKHAMILDEQSRRSLFSAFVVNWSAGWLAIRSTRWVLTLNSMRVRM